VRVTVTMCVAILSAVCAPGGVTVEIVNGSMTDGGATPSNWDCAPAFTFARDTGDFKSAPASMRVVLEKKTAGNVTQGLTPAPGQAITISGWSKASAPEKELAQYQVAVQTWDADRNKIAWQEVMMRISWRDAMTHDWTAFSKEIEISDKTRSMTLVIYLRGKGTVWFDDLRVEGAGGAGGGGGGQPARASAATRTSRGDDACFLRRRDTVLVLGDAITAEGGVYRRVLDGLREEYDDLEAGDRPRLVNAAAPGATAASILRMLPGRLDAARPDVVAVCCGTNDSYRDLPGYYASMRGIVAALKERSVAVTLLTPPPIDASKRPELRVRATAVDDMAGQLRRLAAEQGVLLVDCHREMKRLVEGGTSLDWGDGVHPNARGRGVMAECLRKAWRFGKPLE